MIDVMIIGGGPAGVSAGTVLQKKGYKTCIIDSQVFPRQKLCAGVLTTKSMKLLHHVYNHLNIENLNVKNIYKIKLLYNRKIIGKYTLNNPHSVVDRAEFDNTLLHYYKNIGGLVLEGQRHYKINYSKHTVTLADGKELAYNYLIGADGINSQIRSYITNHAWKASILCFEDFIPNISNEDIIEIDFGGVLGGYSWRIPGNDKIGIGLGEFYIRGMKRKPGKYQKYFSNQGIKNINNIKGAFVSYGNYVRNPIKNNVMLVGDAAGLIDAMTGEGIYFAIESGRQAALTIINHIEKNISLNTYKNRLKKIHKKINEQSLYNKLLYVPILQQISLAYIRKHPKFAQDILDDAISTYHTGYTEEIRHNN